MKKVPVNRRGTIRNLACAIEVPKSTLHDRLKEGTIFRRITSAVKPFLTDQNKLTRLKFCLSHVKPNGSFDDMYNVIHIDEKWFYMS